ncbi:uncharacterized protein [Penaeus vannamei]|uniref:uncharacterized protein n=1 Tax=Penaeus vannamei TaxID=6689 RepID=UPI00387F8C7B
MFWVTSMRYLAVIELAMRYQSAPLTHIVEHGTAMQVTVVRLVGGQIVSDSVAVRERWAEYFGQLYQVDPPTAKLNAGSAVIPLPDPPISEDPASLIEVGEVISKLKSGKAADCIHALRVIVECCRESGRGLLAANIDLKKAFDTCGGALSSFFPVSSGVRQGCVLAPTHFNTYMDWILGRATVQSHCGATLGNIKVTDLDFANDAILSESLETLVVALSAFRNEVKPLGLEILDQGQDPGL